MTIDIDAIREKWATVCGPCDGGLPQGCTCPTGDPRVPISALLTEVSEVTAERDFSINLLDGTAKTLGLDLDNYHVHSEIPAKAAELVAELEQMRESARYYSAQVADLAGKLHKAQQEIASHTKAGTAWANENAWLRSKLADLGKPADAYHWVNLDGKCESDCPECAAIAAIGMPTRVGTTGRTSNTNAPIVGTSTDALTERLAGVVADMLSRFRGDGPNSRHSGWVRDETVAAWRAVYAEWASQYEPATTEAELTPADRAQEPQPGQFCTKHFSWLCQAGQGRCQAEKAEVAR